MQQTGSLKRYNQEKGFGFIAPDTGGSDLFAPKRTFVGVETSIIEGMKVSYQSDIESRTSKPFASSWQAMEGGAMGGLAGFGAGIGATAGVNSFSPYGMGMPMMGTMPGMAAAMPTPVATPAGLALPAGWEAATDPSSGKTYYCNRATGESSWTVPGGAAEPAAAAATTPAAAPAAASGLPAGWEKAADPSTGKEYYFNRATGQSSWEVPTA